MSAILKFITKWLLPDIEILPKNPKIIIHITESGIKLDLDSLVKSGALHRQMKAINDLNSNHKKGNI